jgi:hypothetical protein
MQKWEGGRKISSKSRSTRWKLRWRTLSKAPVMHSNFVTGCNKKHKLYIKLSTRINCRSTPPSGLGLGPCPRQRFRELHRSWVGNVLVILWGQTSEYTMKLESISQLAVIWHFAVKEGLTQAQKHQVSHLRNLDQGSYPVLSCIVILILLNEPWL